MMGPDVEKRLRAVAANYGAFARGLPEPLKRQSSLLKKTLAKGSKNLVEHYGAKEAYPLLRFPLWLEDKYVNEGRISYRDGCGVTTATAALFGYLYIRIQDNVLDEPDEFDSAHLLLSNEFVREFFETYAGLFPPGSPFWGYLREFWRGTSNNTLWERNNCAGRLGLFDAEDLEKIGGKLDGAKVSIASVCLLAGKEQDVARMCAAMDRLNIACQLHNDVVSFVKDLRNRYFTSVIAGTIGDTGALEEGEVFRKASIRALTGDHLEKWLKRAIKYNQSALAQLGGGELPGLGEYVGLKNGHLEDLHRELGRIKRELLNI